MRREKAEYGVRHKQDEYGERMFYFYNPALMSALAGDGFALVYEAHETIGKNDWCTLALQLR